MIFMQLHVVSKGRVNVFLRPRKSKVFQVKKIKQANEIVISCIFSMIRSNFNLE